MLPDRVSNPGPLTYESGALPTALRSPAAGKRDIIVTILFSECACVHVSVQICPEHNLYKNTWISNNLAQLLPLRRRSTI